MGQTKIGFNKKYIYPASLACQVRSAIRIKEELPYQIMAGIFKGEVEYVKEKHEQYFLAFFEMCRTNLIHKFMKEQDISRENILQIFYKLPQRGEIQDFQEELKNGTF